jgi:addiction module HigA family antidote
MPNRLIKALRPVHPGEVLREDILPAVGRTKVEIARALRISRQTLYDILGERQPVTPAMALHFARMFGGSPEAWLNMQRNYDLALAKRELADELKAIPEFAAAA